MDKCPKCGCMLNNDEKASGKCFSCGETFESILAKDTTSEDNYNDDENSIAKAIKIMASIVLILGSIGSFAVSINYGKSNFSFEDFIVPETVTIVSGFIFLGFGEVITLLQAIKNKLH
ncbi:MAG: hypothetical protein J6B84_03260 [Eubacterium sp.]|nr:hypothetical protein [Eubacterium sp.]